MRAIASTVFVAGLSCALWATGMAPVAEGSTVRNEAMVPVVRTAAVVETDAQRRQKLNARLAEMVRNGEGARLHDARARSIRPATTRAPARPRSATLDRTALAPVARVEAARPVGSSDKEASMNETSTIAPPVYRGGPTLVSGRGYRPPRLDLVTRPRIPDSDIECLTQAIYYEARNESEEGQSAVAEVIINRSRTGAYPRRICDVVYQRNSRTCQFTFTCDGSIGRSPIQIRAWGRAERIAREVLDGRAKARLPRTSVNYHANYVRPSWGRRLERVRQIGAHIFYGAALNGQSTPGSLETKPETARPGGLQFVRIEALDRAYESLSTPNAAGTASP